MICTVQNCLIATCHALQMPAPTLWWHGCCMTSPFLTYNAAHRTHLCAYLTSSSVHFATLCTLLAVYLLICYDCNWLAPCCPFIFGQGFVKGVLGTRFGSLELKIVSWESAQIIIESQESENRIPRIREIVSLQVHTRYLTFSLKKPDLAFSFPCLPVWK